MVEVKIALATPLDVLAYWTPSTSIALTNLSVPAVVLKLTKVPSSTKFPKASVTVALMMEVLNPLASIWEGEVETWTEVGGPEANVTVICPLTPAEVAVTVAVPAFVEVILTTASPLTVWAVVWERVPRLVEKTTEVPSMTGFPFRSMTFAVMVKASIPLAVREPEGVAERVMMAGGPGSK